MFKLLIATAAVAGACTAPGADPPPVTDCPAGIEVTVWDTEPTPCDLDGSQTLTILGTTEAACDQAGGRWWYEACVGIDY